VIVLVGAVAFALTRQSGEGGGPPGRTGPTTISGNLFRIDLEAARITAGISVPPGSQSSGASGSVAVGGDFAWVASRVGLIKVNGAGSVIGTLTDVPCLFATVAADEDGVWVASPALENDRVFHVDPTTNNIVAEIPTPPFVSGISLPGTPIAVSASAVWVTDVSNDRLLRINPRTDRIVARIPLPAYPTGVAASEDSVWVWSNEAIASVIRIDPATNKVVGTVTLPGGADGLAIGPGSVWVTDGTNDTVVKIDARTNSIATTLHVGVGPQSIVVDPNGNVWVSITREESIAKLNGVTGEVETTVRVPSALAGGASFPARKGLAVGLGSLWVA
jgi:hypothetical protein